MLQIVRQQNYLYDFNPKIIITALIFYLTVLFWDDKNTVKTKFALNQKLNMCCVGLPLPIYEIKSRGHRAFLKVITVFVKFYGITFCVC